MMIALGTVEVLGSTLGGADKVKVELDNGTKMGSLTGSLDGYNDGTPYFLETHF